MDFFRGGVIVIKLTERDPAIVEEARDVLFPKLAEDGISVLIVFFSPGDFGP